MTTLVFVRRFLADYVRNPNLMLLVVIPAVFVVVVGGTIGLRRFPRRLIDGALTQNFDKFVPLLIGLGRLAVVALAVALTYRRAIRRTPPLQLSRWMIVARSRPAQ